MKVTKPKSNTQYFVSRSIGEHDHTTVLHKRKKQSSDLREYIYDLKFKDGMKPRKIKEHLKRNRPNEPLTIRQIRHILTTESRSKIPDTFSFGELIEWLKSQTKIPECADSAFVIDWTHKREDSSFAFAISTRRLLVNACGQKNVCADGTYKITWQGFPLIVVGTIDRQNHFHVISIVVTSNERSSEYKFVFESIKRAIEQQSGQPFVPEVLISDYAAAIRNAFFAVFGATKNVICSVHLFRKLRERGGLSNKDNKKLLLNDVTALYSAPDADTFDLGASLFLEKWQEMEEEFCYYFKATWLGETTRNWFRGYSPFVPDHNNGVVRILLYLYFRVIILSEINIHLLSIKIYFSNIFLISGRNE